MGPFDGIRFELILKHFIHSRNFFFDKGLETLIDVTSFSTLLNDERKKKDGKEKKAKFVFIKSN